MPAPGTIHCWVEQTEDAQRFWLYETLGGTEMDLECFTKTTADEQRWLIYQEAGPVVNGPGDLQCWAKTTADEQRYWIYQALS